MLVKSVSFGSFGAPASKSEHKKLDKLAKEFTSGRVEYKQLVPLHNFSKKLFEYLNPD